MCDIPDDILGNATLYKKYLQEQMEKEFGNCPYYEKKRKSENNYNYENPINDEDFKSWYPYTYTPIRKSRSYEILQIEPPITEVDVKRAFRKLALEYHPDKPTGDHNKFVEINTAYQELLLLC